MTKTTVANLEKQFRRLLGEERHIEKEAEELTGSELIDKINEIHRRQRKIWEKKQHIANTIQLYDADWCWEGLLPIRPVNRRRAPGTISKPVLKVLANSDMPLSTTEIMKLVKPVLTEQGVELPTNVHLRNNIHALLDRKAGKTVRKHETAPVTWSLIRRAKQA